MIRRRVAPFIVRLRLAFPLSKALHGDLRMQPFFVFGSGRNGSTLLNRLLNTHSRIFLPSEQYFLPSFIYRFILYNDQSSLSLNRKLLQLIQNKELHTWQNMEKIHLDMEPLQEMIDKIYRAEGGVGEDAIWGDSTPVNTRYIGEIFRVFPKASYIFLVRDGRDVVASYQKDQRAFDHLPDLPSQVDFWVDSISKYKWLSGKTQVLLIKYEDLVAKPAEVLCQCYDFLGVKDESDQWSDYLEQIPENEFYRPIHHSGLRKLPFGNSVGAWKDRLTEPQKKFCDLKMKDWLSEYGYHL